MAHLKKGADGHLIKNAAGHLVKTCVTAANCGYCDNDYYQYEIVISGTVLCEDCLYHQPVTGSSSASFVVVPPNINGTYLLTQNIGPYGGICAWGQIINGSFGTIRVYGDVNCVGGYTDYDLNYRFIHLRKDSSTSWLCWIIDTPASPALTHPPGSVWHFYNRDTIVVASGNCEEVSGSNLITCGNIVAVGAYGATGSGNGNMTATPFG